MTRAGHQAGMTQEVECPRHWRMGPTPVSHRASVWGGPGCTRGLGEPLSSTPSLQLPWVEGRAGQSKRHLQA